ncbi:ADP-ribosylglycohydrolase family protein [Psychromonas sp. KJ10-10]|uniref:ADP-ribosylglycohydrolase family protein n=1 Tax=Psychromonas sp. KJ10-10 TaxID=3391823 RepID=UPI0039B63EDA
MTITDTEIYFIKNINADSIRNGSAMRSVPLGLIKDKSEMLEKAKIQASFTHNTHEGIVASQAVALGVYYFINNIGPKNGLFNYVCEQSMEYFKKDKTTATECDAIDTIDSVLTVLSKSETLSEVLFNAVQLGGDTDSVASIACGIASFSDEYTKDLPAFLDRDLENGKYGKDYLKAINAKLLEHYAI